MSQTTRPTREVLISVTSRVKGGDIEGGGGDLPGQGNAPSAACSHTLMSSFPHLEMLLCIHQRRDTYMQLAARHLRKKGRKTHTLPHACTYAHTREHKTGNLTNHKHTARCTQTKRTSATPPRCSQEKHTHHSGGASVRPIPIDITSLLF